MIDLATISALRAQTTAPAPANVEAYYSVGDGGGGIFVCNPSDTTSSDNGGTIIVDAGGNRWYRQLDGCTVTDRQFGAMVDGVTDDGLCIQAAINWLESATSGPVGYGKGGTVKLIAGTRVVNTGLVISNGGITLEGVGWEEYTGYYGEYSPGIMGQHGSYVLTTNQCTTTITCVNTSNHCTIRDIAFAQNQPPNGSGWSPTPYPATIFISGNDGGSALLERLFCWNCYYFIWIGNVGNSTGRVDLKHIWGMPLFRGITVAYSADILRIDDVHFYPFMQGVQNISEYIQNNSTAIMSIRNDNMMMNNFYAYGYNIGMLIAGSTDGTSNKLQLSNIDFDSCRVAFQLDDISSPNGTMQVSNICHQAPDDNVNAGMFIYVDSSVNGYTIDITNAQTTFCPGSCLNISGNSDVSISNFRVNYWNVLNTGATVVVVYPGSTVTLSGRYAKLGGYGAGDVSGGGTFNNSHVN